MSIKIINITLDKKEYIFWIDAKIKLSFELFSDTEEDIKELNIFYWYNFFWNTQKHNAFQETMKEENIVLEKNYGKKFSYEIPIHIFNFNTNDDLWNTDLVIKNYINIQITNGVFHKYILQKIKPKILFNPYLYWIKYFHINKHMSFWKKYLTNIEEWISKIDEEKYKKISKKFNKIFKKIIKKIKKYNKKKHSKEKNDKLKDTYHILDERLISLLKKKQSLFILKNNKNNELISLQKEEDIIINDHKKIIPENIKEYCLLKNNFQKLEYKLYKICYFDEEEKYYELLDLYFSEIINIPNTEELKSSHFTDKIKKNEEIQKEKYQFQIIKRKFKWINNRKDIQKQEDNPLLIDYVHNEIFQKLQKNIIINMFTKFINSQLYIFIYKYAFALPFIGWFWWEDIFYNENHIYIVIFFIIPIIFIFFSKWLERLFKTTMDNAIYDCKLVNSEKLKNNLEQKLITWTLHFSDIFEKFQLKVYSSMMDYNLSITLKLYTWIYYSIGNKTFYDKVCIYSLQLFNTTWKGNFDSNKITLLKNNYQKLNDILINSCKDKKTEVFYSIVYNFDSSYLPDLNWEKKLYLNFKLLPKF